MPKNSCFKDVEKSPLSGLLDLRSPDGGLAQGDYRIILNMSLNEQRSRCRMGGWKKLFADSQFGFKNQDFHDQLINCQFYYEEFNGVYESAGGLTGHDYLYWIPGQTIPGTLHSFEYGPYCGYAPDSPLPQTPTFDSLFVSDSFEGYPYFTFPTNPANVCSFDGAGGEPDFYPGSYYFLGYNHQDPDTVIPPSGSGLTGVYTQAYSIPYTFCGDHAYLHPGCREAITMLGEITSENRTRKLVLGTKSKLAVLNERTGNWRLIADGLGGPYNPDDNCICSSRRFKMATLGGYAFFSNNYNPVLAWRFDAPTGGCEMWSAEYIQDLLDLGILRARTIACWKGFLFVANVDENGSNRPFRIFWSDFNAPTSFLPGGESLAGFSDLSADENILDMQTLGGGLRVYTDKAIYEVILVGGDQVFNFRELYRGSRALRYEHSIANSGDSHFFLGEDTIYVLRESDRSPNHVEWIHKASGAIYRGVAANNVKSFTGLTAFGPINKSLCGHAIGYYRKSTDEVFFSWPAQGHNCPSHTLAINVKYGGSSLIDHGFTAFGEMMPDPKQTFIEWLISEQVCDWSSFLGQLVKEGEPYSQAVGAFTNPPSSIINATEDPALPVDANSLCGRLGRKTVEDLCPDCANESVFIMASAVDKTLKEFDPDIYYRERYIDPGVSYECPHTIPGAYAIDGYTSLLQTDMHDYGNRREKLINRVTVDFDATEQTTPNALKMQIGYAANANCPLWSETVSEDLECVTAYTDSQHLTNQTRPNMPAVFNFYRRGRFLGSRLWVDGTGGGACFSRVTEKLRLAQGDW